MYPCAFNNTWKSPILRITLFEMVFHRVPKIPISLKQKPNCSRQEPAAEIYVWLHLTKHEYSILFYHYNVFFILIKHVITRYYR